jgi:hypothetical protein
VTTRTNCASRAKAQAQHVVDRNKNADLVSILCPPTFVFEAIFALAFVLLPVESTTRPYARNIITSEPLSLAHVARIFIPETGWDRGLRGIL